MSLTKTRLSQLLATLALVSCFGPPESESATLEVSSDEDCHLLTTKEEFDSVIFTGDISSVCSSTDTPVFIRYSLVIDRAIVLSNLLGVERFVGSQRPGAIRPEVQISDNPSLASVASLQAEEFSSIMIGGNQPELKEIELVGAGLGTLSLSSTVGYALGLPTAFKVDALVIQDSRLCELIAPSLESIGQLILPAGELCMSSESLLTVKALVD